MRSLALALAVLACTAQAGSLGQTRRRRIDEIGLGRLISPSAHARTRATHRRMMATWRSVSSDVNAPTVFPTSYGADPTGKSDSTAAFVAAMQAVLAHNTSGHTMSEGIADLGGVVLDLQGGDYLLSAPVVVPAYYGNMRIIDGTLRASASFDPSRYLIEVGDAKACSNGQGSCNENVGMSGLTLDGSHIASGCLKISAAMGATLDSSSAIFGFTTNGIALDGGHETMIQETWVAAYFWDSPLKEKNNSTGIGIYGNDHYVTNTIVFSAKIGVHITGAADILNGVHTWNDATGNGGIGVLNEMSQNRFVGVYLDFTDLVLTNADQTVVTNSFFLGGAQVLLTAPKAGSSMYGLTIANNVWYDTGSAALAVNETVGTWTGLTDVVVTGNALQRGQPAAPTTRVTKVYTPPAGTWPNNTITVDFSDVLLFPHAPIATATAQVVGMGVLPNPNGNSLPPVSVPTITGTTVSVYAPVVMQAWPGAAFSIAVTVDQSVSSATFKA